MMGTIDSRSILSIGVIWLLCTVFLVHGIRLPLSLKRGTATGLGGVELQEETSLQPHKSLVESSAIVSAIPPWGAAWLNIATDPPVAATRTLHELRRLASAQATVANPFFLENRWVNIAAGVGLMGGNVIMPPGAAAGFTFVLDDFGRVRRAHGLVAGTQGSLPFGAVNGFLDVMVAADLDSDVRDAGLWTAGHIIAASLGGPAPVITNGAGVVQVGAANANKGWTNVNPLNFFPQMAIHNNLGSPYSDQEVLAACLYRHLGANCVNIDVTFIQPGAAVPHPGGSGNAAHPLVGGAQPFYIPTGGRYTVNVINSLACLPGGGTLAQRWVARLAQPPTHPVVNADYAAADLALITRWGMTYPALSSGKDFANYVVLSALSVIENGVGANILGTKDTTNFGHRASSDVNVPFRISQVAILKSGEAITCTDSSGLVSLIGNGVGVTSGPYDVAEGAPKSIVCSSPLAGSWKFRVIRAAPALTNLALTCVKKGTVTAKNVAVPFSRGTMVYNIDTGFALNSCTLTPTFTGTLSSTIKGGPKSQLPLVLTTTIAQNYNVRGTKIILLLQSNLDGLYTVTINGK